MNAVEQSTNKSIRNEQLRLIQWNRSNRARGTMGGGGGGFERKGGCNREGNDRDDL